MIGRLRDMLRGKNGEWVVSFTTLAPFGDEFDRLAGKDCEITIKRYSKKRSRTANAFCWALCSDIGKAMTPPLAKEEVYRMAIKAVGVFDTYQAKEEAVESLMRRWAANGEGWFAEVVDNSWLPGCKKLHIYYGSSTYTADEMRVLIDWLVDQAEQMGLAIPLSKAEQERMIEQWGKKAG